MQIEDILRAAIQDAGINLDDEIVDEDDDEEFGSLGGSNHDQNSNSSTNTNNNDIQHLIDDPFSLAIRELEVHNEKIDKTLPKRDKSPPPPTLPLPSQPPVPQQQQQQQKKIIKIFNQQQQQPVTSLPQQAPKLPQPTSPSIRIIKLNTTTTTGVGTPPSPVPVPTSPNTDLNSLISYRTASPNTALNGTQIKVINLKNNKISTLNDYYSQQQKQQQQQQQQHQQPTIIQIPKQLTSIKELTAQQQQRRPAQFILNTNPTTTTTTTTTNGIQITKVVSSRTGCPPTLHPPTTTKQQQQQQQQHHNMSAPLLRLCGGPNNHSMSSPNLHEYLSKSQQQQQHQQQVAEQQQHQHDEEIVVEEDEELGHAETYADYMPSKLKIGLRHPDPVVETSSLASVEPPEVWYKLKMPEHVYEDGALSALQLEAIVYASQKHETFLPNNHRAGFLIGDGAGVGKGRTIAGIIYENYLLGRKKSIWLSVSNDLKYDAQRDLHDIGAHRIDVHALNKLKYCKINSKLNSKIKKGVIFATYSSLIGESQNTNTKKKYNTRLKQLLKWLGDDFDGVIVFDECHKAKNLVPVGSAKPTKTGLAVLELQEKLPNARIIYASATGASEPKNMAYMVRLGLWGPGTPFNDFNEFIQCIEKRGVGAMEIVAMDMKLRGMYMARQLSFSGVTFKIQEIKLTDEYVKMYNDSVKLWVQMKEKFQEGLDLIDTDGRLRKTIWGQFWSAHQRFFKYLCMASKVTHVVDLARNALHSSKCVVIGLQSTGESRTVEQLEEMNGELSEFVSTARGVLQNLIDKHFPTFDLLNGGNGVSTVNATANGGASASSGTNAQKPSFLDILGIGDHVREQLGGNGNGRSKESKNSKKVNEILKRLSSYTNQNPTMNNNTNKVKKESNSDSSAASSATNSGESSDDDEDNNNNNNNENEKKSTSKNTNSNKKLTAEEVDNADSYDDEYESDIDDDDDDDEEEDEEEDTENEPEKPIIIPDLKVVKNDDSDDSDSLFSIVRTSVSLCNTNTNIIKKKFRKKKKRIPPSQPLVRSQSDVNNNNNNNENDDEDLSVPAKRIKLEEVESPVPQQQQQQPPQKLNKEELLKTKNLSQIHQYLSESKADLLENLKLISKQLPANTLDELIDNLDGPRYVAEMTGRKGRVVANEDGNILYESRNENDNVPLELINIVQKEQFMNGEKLIAIISEAASSGISLQANRRNANQRRRVHITIELPWSADRAIQQFGRTHRSNQVSAPEYIFLISELAGEKRFASTVAKRLESLGALTHGDRRATETRDLSRFNIDNKYGRVALENVIKSICGHEKPLAKIPSNYIGENFFLDARNALNGVGLINITSNKLPNGTQIINAYPDKDYTNINKFLNRLLGCPVNLQNAIFTYFSDVLAAVILDAKRTGKWDMGILDLGGKTSFECVFKTKTKFFVLNNKIICSSNPTIQNSKIPTSISRNEDDLRRVELHTVIVERGLTWEKALEIAANLKEPQGFYVSNQVRNNHRIAILAVYSNNKKTIQNGNANEDTNFTSFSIYKPNTGLQVRLETLDSLTKKYKRVPFNDAREHWEEQYYKSIAECTHVYRQGICKNQRTCEIGLRNRKYHVLAGSVLIVWAKIENILCSLLGSQQCRLQIIRIKTTSDQKIVGCVIPTTCLKQVDNLLKSLSSKTYEEYENTDLFDMNNNNNQNQNQNNSDNDLNLDIFNNLTSRNSLTQTLNTFNTNFDFI